MSWGAAQPARTCVSTARLLLHLSKAEPGSSGSSLAHPVMPEELLPSPGAGAGTQPFLRQPGARSHLPGLRAATGCRNVGISGAHLRAPHLPPPAAGAGFHCGGSQSLQTLGGSWKQSHRELRGWVRTSVPIAPAAPGAAAKRTADILRSNPLMWGEGRFQLRPVPGIRAHPAPGAAVLAPKEPRAQPPTPAWLWDKPCRGQGAGSSPALSSQAGLQGRHRR